MTGRWVVGVDFGGPVRARDQQRKIIALAATERAPGRFVVDATGLNSRVLTGPRPGYSAQELADALLQADPAPEVVGLDLPFSLPVALLDDPAFAESAGHQGPFCSWLAFHQFVAARLPLTDPLDLAPFAAWRSTKNWLRRDTDRAAAAQPPLKHRFQVTFNMTLLGNALLARLRQSGRYQAVPLEALPGRARIVEVYPGLLLRRLKISRQQGDPALAVKCVVEHLAELGIALELDPAVARFCATYDTGKGNARDLDGLDALAALALTLLVQRGRARAWLTHPGADVAREGAIYGPG